MTVSSDVNKITYAGNGSTQVFSVNYYFLADSHLQVVLITTAGVETVQTLTTNYTVTGAGNEAGGSITMLVAPPTGVSVVIQRVVPATQETDYLANDPFPAESHERALDKLTMLVQQNERENDRSLKIPLSAVPTTSTELPAPVGNKLLAWNSNASAIINFNPADIITIVGQQTSYGDVFTGNGVTTDFTLARSPGSVFGLDVSINGVTQVPNVDYTLGGTTLTFTSAPPAAASQILARYAEVYEEVSADAQNVRYVPAGAGAVTTNVQAKLRETVSVKDFGAVGDGVTDDTAAIQAAIDYADATAISGVGTSGVVFPAGVYKVTTGLTLNRNSQLIGVGWPEIKAFHDGDVITVIGIPSALIFPKNQQTFLNLRFTTNVGNTPASIIRLGTDSGLTPTFINSSLETKISNCQFDECTATYVIDNNRGYGLTISNCLFKNFTATAALKLRQVNSEIPYWSYATAIYSTEFTNITAKAIEADAGDLSMFNCIIQGCSVGGVNVGANVANTGSQPVNFYGCYFEGNTNYHVKVDNGRVTANFSGCKFVKASSAFNHITFVDATQVIFTSCSSPNNAPTISGGNVSFNGCNYMQQNTGAVNSYVTDRNTQYTSTPTTTVEFSGVSGFGPRIYGSPVPGPGGGGVLLMCSHSAFPVGSSSVTELFLIVTKITGTTVNAVSLGRSENGDTSTFSFGVSAGGYLTVTASEAGHANYTLISQSRYPVALPG
jgi:uncharacterized protein YjbI with pentapeptide repeats